MLGNGLMIVGLSILVWLVVSEVNSPEAVVQEMKSEMSSPEAVLQEMNEEYGKRWKQLGFVRWIYNPPAATTFIISDAFSKLPQKKQEQRINQIGEDFTEIMTGMGGASKDINIMIHDQKNRMPAIYTSVNGVELK